LVDPKREIILKNGEYVLARPASKEIVSEEQIADTGDVD